jgi:hypothetical protein
MKVVGVFCAIFVRFNFAGDLNEDVSWPKQYER